MSHECKRWGSKKEKEEKEGRNRKRNNKSDIPEIEPMKSAKVFFPKITLFNTGSDYFDPFKVLVL
jgi:hypothetical protein